MRTWLLVCFCVVLAAPALASELSIPLTVVEPAGLVRTAEPVSAGIPMPWGKIKAGQTFALFDGTKEIPLQAIPLVVDENGFLRWVLVDFQTDLAAKGTKTFTLKTAKPAAAPGAQIKVTDDAKGVAVDTGEIQFTILKDQPFTLVSTVSGPSGKKVTDGGVVSYTDGFDGKKYVADKPTSIAVEYVGPMRATICVKGRFVGAADAWMQQSMRVVAPAIHSDDSMGSIGWGHRTPGAAGPGGCKAMSGDKDLWTSAGKGDVSEGWLAAKTATGTVWAADLYFADDPPRQLAAWPLPMAEPRGKYGLCADVDFWSDPPTIWISPGSIVLSTRGDVVRTAATGILLLAEKGDKLEVISDFQRDAQRAVVRTTAPENNRQRLYWDPRRDLLYVGEDGFYFRDAVVIDPATGKTKVVNLPFDAEDMAFDADGLAYLRTPGLYDGKPYFNFLAGTLMKFRPCKAKIVSDAGTPVGLSAEGRPQRPPDLSNLPGSAWADGADSFFGGVGWHGKNHGLGCGCRNTRFALDYFGRSFAPEIDRYSVAVLDSAGNVILRVGRYGNVDDGQPLVSAGGPPTPRSIGGDEVAIMHGAYVATQTDRRLFVADIGNYRILSIKLDYHLTENVPLKSVKEEK